MLVPTSPQEEEFDQLQKNYVSLIGETKEKEKVSLSKNIQFVRFGLKNSHKSQTLQHPPRRNRACGHSYRAHLLIKSTILQHHTPQRITNYTPSEEIAK